MTTQGQEPNEEGKKPDAENLQNKGNSELQETFSREYVQELRQEAAKHRTELKKLQEAEEERAKKQKEAEEKRLESQKEFETLANERKSKLDDAEKTINTYKAELEAQTAVLSQLYESRKSLVPEMYQPLLDEMSLIKRLEWIAANESKLKPASTNNGIPHTPNPKGTGDLTPDQRRAAATRTW